MERVFYEGDKVLIKLSARQSGPSKFQSVLSLARVIENIRGVLISARKFSTNRSYIILYVKPSAPVRKERLFIESRPHKSHRKRAERRRRGNKTQDRHAKRSSSAIYTSTRVRLRPAPVFCCFPDGSGRE